MKRVNQRIAATIAFALMAFTAAAPANAIVDKNGNVVGVIITPDGEMYY